MAARRWSFGSAFFVSRAIVGSFAHEPAVRAETSARSVIQPHVRRVLMGAPYHSGVKGESPCSGVHGCGRMISAVVPNEEEESH